MSTLQIDFGYTVRIRSGLAGISPGLMRGQPVLQVYLVWSARTGFSASKHALAYWRQGRDGQMVWDRYSQHQGRWFSWNYFSVRKPWNEVLECFTKLDLGVLMNIYCFIYYCKSRYQPLQVFDVHQQWRFYWGSLVQDVWGGGILLFVWVICEFSRTSSLSLQLGCILLADTTLET